jgi:hypothetical protein
MRGAQLTPVRRPQAPYRGLRLVRPRGHRRGLGDTALQVVSPFTGTQLAQQDLQAYLATLSTQVEQGTAPTVDQVAANISGDVASYCASWPDRCAGGTPDVTALIAQYAQSLGTNQQRVYTGAVDNTLALPLPTSAYPAPVVLPSADTTLQTMMQKVYQANQNLAAPAAVPVVTAPPAPAAQSNAPAPTVAGPIDMGYPAQSNAPNSGVVIPGVASSMGWLTESMFGGIPNWVMVAGVAGALWAFSGGRR